MYTHANIMNKKNAKTTANVSTANVAMNNANKLSVVRIKMVPPLVLINQVLVRVYVHT